MHSVGGAGLRRAVVAALVVFTGLFVIRTSNPHSNALLSYLRHAQQRGDECQSRPVGRETLNNSALSARNNTSTRISEISVNYSTTQEGFGKSDDRILRNHAPVPQGHVQQRRLAPKNGSVSVLSVYVTSVFGETPIETMDEIRQRLFGIGHNAGLANTSTLLELYDHCSFGSLRMQPANEGNGVVDGLVHVSVPFRLADGSCSLSADQGDSSSHCRDQISEATESTLGRSLDTYDITLFCVPDGIMYMGSTNWFAFAFIGQRSAFFNRGFCTPLSGVSHECGHLLGFGHSNLPGGQEYLDGTDLMGTSLNEIGGPLYCFNGHKYGLSGWMAQTTETIDVSGNAPLFYYGRLVAFVDKPLMSAASSSTDRTLLRLDSGGASAFVLYNRKKSFNSGVPELGDRITITRTSPSDEIESERVGSLGDKEKLFLADFNVVIEVCSLETDGAVDFAVVTVYSVDSSRPDSPCVTGSQGDTGFWSPPGQSNGQSGGLSCPSILSNSSFYEWVSWLKCARSSNLDTPPAFHLPNGTSGHVCQRPSNYSPSSWFQWLECVRS
jgi:Gametolysin peptidase M11